MLAASPIPAAEPSSAVTGGKTLVVRADPRTGKLVRLVAAPRTPKPPQKEITDLVDKAARKHDVDPLLVDSLIRVESDYDPHAVSPKGAQGLMQLMPSTAKMLGVSDSFDPGENIEAGVKYLKYLQGLYQDDRLALAAYNAGPAAVEKFNNVPPYRETRDYVDKVGRRYDEARKAAAQAAQAQQPPQNIQAQPEERHPKLEVFTDGNGRLYLRTQ